ncbi:MAG: hypothetical protein COW03_16140 [Cytophagales bacterium CG12_big_fil_rev_8_21_14_0_65_40_12]|nr:MAG: hypothetical protein COW03_16140 [Cytophagales bacterium CG12_big_fil_rev_8_21_14_0_65_40_12]PIW06060.1 MAG: hypothetical protein COW40_01395 [Cytophagales bacterium CG17_big_fil_post_rev_8_21_14_2_50_40_13]
MKKLLFLFFLLPLTLQAQEDKPKRIIPSLTDWIEEINNWPDSIYEVKNIKVLLDVKKDSRLIESFSPSRDTVRENIAAIANKSVTVEGLEFDNSFGVAEVKAIKNIHFKGWLRISDYTSSPVPGFSFINMIFDDRFTIKGSDRFTYFNFSNCEFNTSVGFFDFTVDANIVIARSEINGYLQATRTAGKPYLDISNSKIERLGLQSSQLGELTIRNSVIGDLSIQNATIETTAHLIDNDIKQIEIAGAQLPDKNTYISFDQISGKLYVDPVNLNNPIGNKYYVKDTLDFELREEYDLLISSYKLLLDGYQKRGDQDSYNNCYVELKDIETRRLAFLYGERPTFKSYFTWKINQFLKVFSAYGTEPARAVIFSLYVILIFALVYLFFPNHWDSHGKNRIMDRYRFFLKYVNRDSGIHEVYLEEQKQDLLNAEDFKTYLLEQGKTAPKFFLATAMPLYKWSVAGTRTFSWFLEKIDFLKGKWSETEPSKQSGKSALLITAFLIALFYDILIKMLNALMLSINTFTTLGFGEIPIKGLPRYLAIIQGFIGWFMLTIFSVSLISQLLN